MSCCGEQHKAIIKSGRAYLPEIEFYKRHMEKIGFSVEVNANKSKSFKSDIKVFWNIMGLDLVRNSKFVIHDYRSCSVPPLPFIKDQIKMRFNCKPDMRIFLNQYVAENFHFQDDVPKYFIDMGVDKSFLQKTDSKKIYDYIYVGDISVKRGLDRFLKHYTEHFHKSSLLCLVGLYDNSIYKEYSKFNNIIFFGKVDYSQIPKILNQSHIGLNLLPNIQPYSHQTSTKLLEYISLDLKIVSRRTKYSEKIMKQSNSKFYMFDSISDLNENDINRFEFITKKTGVVLDWDTILSRSGVFEIIRGIFEK